MPEHDLSGDEPVPRPEVIQAVLSALIDMDPAKLAPLRETGITAVERKQAEELFATTMLATADHRQRQIEAWEVLIGRDWPAPPTWQEMFDELTLERADRLRELYDALPDGARAEYDRRYGHPENI